jgi:teichuronic acid biosynthesis glycosyltransferase TuaG
MKPIVSVIIPVYNNALYIRKSIDSVLNQSIAVELIIIDDCSTDNIDKVLDKYKSYNNIIYLKNNLNIGVAASRNLGVDQAKGKYIAFLDSDDWWATDKLEKQIIFMEEKNAVISYTGRRLVTSQDTLTNNIIHVPKQVDYNKLLHHNCIACSSVILLKNIAKEYPMGHDQYHEDYITWLMILKKYGQAYGIDEPLLMYRMSNNGKSRKKLKSARMTYGVYRIIGYSRIKAVYYMFSHLLHATYKYIPRYLKLTKFDSK